MNTAILNTDVQLFINKNLQSDITKLILKGSPFESVSIQELSEQILSKKKCQLKLPTWYHTNQIYYPTKVSIEQSSSEITARYKASLVSGNRMIDITGGFGVDDLAFAKNFKHVIHCEIKPELSEIVKHNFSTLGADNIETLTHDGLKFLAENNQKYDLIYSDPSRRNNQKGRVFLLEDCLPNIPENLDLLFAYSDHIMLKLSPVLDLTSTVKELKNITEIHVVAVNNEVKELLFILKKDFEEKIQIRAVNITTLGTTIFDSVFRSGNKSEFSHTLTYLYEPNAAILKAGLFNEVSSQLNIYKLHTNSHLYTTNVLIDFPGRRFKIQQILSYDKKKLKKALPLKKANITVRNFPENVAQIRKRTGIKEGGENYLFFTTDINGKHLVLDCEKV